MSLCFIFRLGAFENGIAEGSIDLSVGEILAIRLWVNSDSPVWAILSEVSLLIKASLNWFQFLLSLRIDSPQFLSNFELDSLWKKMCTSGELYLIINWMRIYFIEEVLEWNN